MKVIVIGGGSYGWALGFLRQFIVSNKLRPLEVALVDIDSDALDLVHAAGGIFNKSHGNPIKITKSVRLEPVLPGADFAIVSISTGGLKAMRHDLAIPEKYGIFHTVGDTVGPGGWLRAARNIPVFYDFARLMRKHCPRAWMINVSNPLTPLTRAPFKYFGVPTIGMCPGVEVVARTLAKLAGAKANSQLDFVVTGIDHGSWFTGLYADGRDVLQRLKKMGFYRSDDRLPAKVTVNDPIMASSSRYRADFAVWREIGFMPAINDRHSVENWPWFIAGDSPARLPFGIRRTTIKERMQGRRQSQARLEQYVRKGDDSLLAHLGHGDDPVVNVIESLCGHGSFLWTSNYRNLGQTPELPPDAVVETRCRFDAAGVHPLSSPMPELLRAMVLPQVVRQEAILDITLKGTFDELVALVLTDPLCSRLPMGAGRRMVREMLLANKSLIKNKRLLKEQ